MRSSTVFCLFVAATTLFHSSSLNAEAKDKPKSSGEWASDGYDKMQAGRYLDAVQNYGHAIKLDKRNPNLYQMRAQANIGASKYKDAVGDASKSIKFAPDDANGYALRAKAYEPMKEYKKEILDLDHLVTMKPNEPAYLLQRAQANAELKEMKDVIIDCDRAINMNLDRNQMADLYKLRAQAYKKLGKKNEAKQEMAKYDSLK